MFDMLMKIPGAEKAKEVLKKKGINGFGDIATAGSKLGKRAAAILPVVGGLVNLAFAYERAANGDSIGALIEGTSGVLDIAGLATAGAGNVASMLLDGYMFVRDFVPQLQQGEEGVVDAIGARGLKLILIRYYQNCLRLVRLLIPLWVNLMKKRTRMLGNQCSLVV